MLASLGNIGSREARRWAMLRESGKALKRNTATRTHQVEFGGSFSGGGRKYSGKGSRGHPDSRNELERVPPDSTSGDRRELERSEQ